MVNVTLVQNTKRSSVIADNQKTPKQLFAEKDIMINGVTVYLNGAPLSSAETEMPLERLSVGADDSITLAMVQKAESAQ